VVVMSWGRVDGRRVMELGSPGQMRQHLVELVCVGKKRATAGLLSLDYRDEGEVLEHVGEQLAVVDNDNRVAVVVVVDRIEVMPFSAVTWEFADAEGEGFTSVEHWRNGHRRFWSRQGAEVREDTEVACLWFHVDPSVTSQNETDLVESADGDSDSGALRGLE
jgi:uncharacterized protein YhfF